MEKEDWIKAYQGNDDPKFFNDEYWNERIYRQKGLEEGLIEGHKEGRQERNIEIAKNMLAKGMNPSDISEITELSLEEINKLKNDKNAN